MTDSSRAHQSRQRRRLTATEVDLGVVRQRALLIGTTYGTATVEEAEASLEELALLADTAGAEPVHSELQRRRTPDPATYIGKGKAEELKAVAEGLDIDVVIFDDELTPAQQRNLEKMFAVDVVDRVALILDIFAQHATSQEGAVQVELAELRYRLPRLRGRGLQLSQQGAGIGTRGPGETQLEVDRRRLLRRTQKLERDLVGLAATRATQRKARKRRDVPHVALVGYTNAGKSTLLNRLTHAGVLVQNQLFSTLDPTVRRLHLPGGETVLVSDTVGFVRRLPHQLVEAFRSTLEEVVDADLLVHMVDASATDVEALILAVDTVLHEIEADPVPRLLVWNKADLADDDDLKILLNAYPGSVAISAALGMGLPDLLTAVGDRLRALARISEFVVPYERGDVLAALHRAGEVLVEVHGDNSTRVRARLPEAAAGRFSELHEHARLVSMQMAATGGFVPPPYPYERLDALKRLADSLPGGVVDCSIGTPCDPVPEVASRAAIDALAASNGYPPSAGSAPLRDAAAGWIRRRFGVEVESAHVGACVGTKELVASLPHLLHLRAPARDTVLYPAIAYPSYDMGAVLAGCRAVPVPLDGQWHLDIDAISDADAARALVLWINEPGNPSASTADDAYFARVVAWARERDITVASDECYAEFAPRPATILSTGLDGVLAMHSVSKRSNLAGMRVGFYAGDPDLVTYLVETRKHAGLMAPTMVQAAAAAALGDDAHVDVQRARYMERRDLMRAALAPHGLVHDGGDAAFYLWMRTADGADDGWEIAARLAHGAGLLVSPGDLYGALGADHVRIALVQPRDRLELALDRLGHAARVKPD